MGVPKPTRIEVAEPLRQAKTSHSSVLLYLIVFLQIKAIVRVSEGLRLCRSGTSKVELENFTSKTLSTVGAKHAFNSDCVVHIAFEVVKTEVLLAVGRYR